MVVVSDDEDDLAPVRKAVVKGRPKGKAKLPESDEDEFPTKMAMSLRAMMDIDDGTSPYVRVCITHSLFIRR